MNVLIPLKLREHLALLVQAKLYVRLPSRMPTSSAWTSIRSLAMLQMKFETFASLTMTLLAWLKHLGHRRL